MQNLMTSHIQSTLLLLCVSTLSSACVVTSHVKKKDCLDGDCSAFTLSKSGLVKQKPDKLDPLSYQYDYSLAGSDIVSEGMLIELDTQKTCQGLHNTVDLYSPNKPNFPSYYVWTGVGAAAVGAGVIDPIIAAVGGLGLVYGGFEWYYFSGKFNYKFPRTEALEFYPCASKERVNTQDDQNVVYSIFPNGLSDSMGTTSPHSIEIHPSQVKSHSSTQLKIIDDQFLIPTHALGFAHMEDPTAPTLKVKPHYDITPPEKEYAPVDVQEERKDESEISNESQAEPSPTPEEQTDNDNTDTNNTDTKVEDSIEEQSESTTNSSEGVNFELLTPTYIYSTEILSITAPSPPVREWYCGTIAHFSYIKTLDEKGNKLPVDQWKIGFTFPDAVSDIDESQSALEGSRLYKNAEMSWQYPDGTAVFRYHKNALRKCDNSSRMNTWNVASNTLRENPTAYREIRSALSGITPKTIYVPKSIRQPSRNPLEEDTSVASSSYDNGYRLEERKEAEVKKQRSTGKKSKKKTSSRSNQVYDDRPPYGRYQCATEGKLANLNISRDGYFLLMVELGLGSGHGICGTRQCQIKGISKEAIAFTKSLQSFKITESNNALLINDQIRCDRK